jgi:hypothetical protein
MKKVSVYILATDKNIHRLKVMCAGGIRAKKNYLKIILMGEGKKPDFLNKNMKWLHWDEYRVTDKHIAIVNKGALEKADYHVFTDDDSFIDVDNMVKCLEKQNIENEPCYWSGGLGDYIGNNNPGVINFLIEKKVKQEVVERCRKSWMGWCFTVFNKKFADIAQRSKESAIVMDYSLNYIKQFIPDQQIPILGAMIGAKHYWPQNGDEILGTQWKDYFSYSGLVDEGKLWHIHYTVDNAILNYDDLINSVKKGPCHIDNAIYGLFKSQLSKELKPKHFVNKNFYKKYFFIYWGYHAWHYPVRDNAVNETIMLKRDGKIISKNGIYNNMRWDMSKKGFFIINKDDAPVAEYRWIKDKSPIGKNLIHGSKVIDMLDMNP